MTADPITAAMAAWWPRPRPPLPPPALRCPTCGAVDNMLVHAKDGSVGCAECKTVH